MNIPEDALSGVYHITYFTKWDSDLSFDPDDYPKKTYTLRYSTNPCVSGFNYQDISATIYIDELNEIDVPFDDGECRFTLDIVD